MDAPAHLVHRDEIGEQTFSGGDVSFRRRRLAAAARASRIGASLYRVEPGARQMPLHEHGDEEEIFYVLDGGGLSVEDDRACEVRAGDAIVQRPGRAAHTFLAGDAGLELLAFGSGSETGLTWLPRAGVMWAGPRWVPLDAPHPFDAEAAAGVLRPPDPTARPANVVAAAAVEPASLGTVEVRGLGAAGGSRLAGLNLVMLPAGATGAPRHCHALEEELFVVLGGSGKLVLGDEEHELRPGHVLARPPGTGVPHELCAGGEGLTYLAYGTRVAGDSVYYPDRSQVRLRGLGVDINCADR